MFAVAFVLRFVSPESQVAPKTERSHISRGGSESEARAEPHPLLPPSDSTLFLQEQVGIVQGSWPAFLGHELCLHAHSTKQ